MCSRNSGATASAARVASSASTTGLPVRAMRSRGTPSDSRVSTLWLGRGEVITREARDQDPVHLLGEGTRRVAGSKPRLDVADGDAVKEARQRAGHGGGGVALDQQEVGTLAGENGVESRHHPRRHLRRGLVLAHHPEIRIDADAEVAGEGVEQVDVLGRGDVHGLEALASPLELGEHRRELDDLRTGAEQREHALHGWRDQYSAATASRPKANAQTWMGRSRSSTSSGLSPMSVVSARWW